MSTNGTPRTSLFRDLNFLSGTQSQAIDSSIRLTSEQEILVRKDLSGTMAQAPAR
jgi:hypothetical protein